MNWGKMNRVLVWGWVAIWVVATLLFCWGVVMLVGHLVPARAQPVGPTPDNFWAEFYSAAKTAGWFGTLIMALMWWRAERRAEIERQDRKDLQTIKDAQTEKTIATMGTVAMTLDATQKIVDKIVLGFDAMKDMLRDLREAGKKNP